MALDLLEATALVGAVAGTAGLAGLALGFAFKDIVENYLAGLLLAFQRPFDKNDHVTVEDHAGKVVRLTPRETILMTMDGNHVRVPNAVDASDMRREQDDVSRDDSVDRQIAEDRLRSDEEDLLGRDDGPSSGGSGSQSP